MPGSTTRRNAFHGACAVARSLSAPLPSSTPPDDLNGSAIVRGTSNARSITPLFNVYGALGLAGGAIYSAYLFFRKGALYHRMLGNVLIAGGALAPAFGGTLSRAGFPYAIQISNLIGIVVIYAGYLQATRTETPTSEVKRETVGAEIQSRGA